MRVLFMCTANSCRSILSEGMFNTSGPKFAKGIGTSRQRPQLIVAV